MRKVTPLVAGYLCIMCLIALAYKAHPRYPLIVAANRDEFMDRPTEPAHWWKDAPGVFAGRDKRAGGTWMGITRSGRFAAITNYRQMDMSFPAGPSRGQLVREALENDIDPSGTAAYAGFNLIYGSLDRLRYHNNINGEDIALSPGILGLSNNLLDVPWPKVVKAKAQLAHLVQQPDGQLAEGLFTLLSDDTRAPDAQLPDTGLPLEAERAASPILIRTSIGYGTRCSTVLLVDRKENVYFEERGVPAGKAVVERFELSE